MAVIDREEQARDRKPLAHISYSSRLTCRERALVYLTGVFGMAVSEGSQKESDNA